MDYNAAAKRLWDLLDREHDGNTIVRDELAAMDWEALSPQVRAVLHDVARTFSDHTARIIRQMDAPKPPPPRKTPDFNALAIQAMERAGQFQTVPQWVAATIAMAYRMGSEGREA